MSFPRSLLSILVVALLWMIRPPAESAAQASQERFEGRAIAVVTVHGLAHLDEDVVRRHMELQPGGPYRAQTARRDERAITAIGIFRSVRIVAEAIAGPAGDQRVAVHVRLEERLPLFALPEVTWVPEEGWSYGLSVGHLNLLRRGHRLFLTARTGGARYLSMSISNAWYAQAKEGFHLGGAVVRATNRLYNFGERGRRLGAEVGVRFGPAQDGLIQAGLRYRDVAADRPGITLVGSGRDRLHGVWLLLGWDTTDPWAYPRLGTMITVRLDASGGPLGGNVAGQTVTMRLQHTESLGEEWVASGRLISERLRGHRPFWQLLNMGGPFSLRGHPLGTWLVDTRWEANAELQWWVVPMHAESLGIFGEHIVGLSFALFADVGRGGGVRRGPGSGPWGERSPLARSWGGGIRLHNVLMGTLRLEVAWDGEGSRPIFYYALGDFF